MADIPDRDLKEEVLAAAVGKELARFGRYLVRTIPGLASAFEAINPQAWTEHTENMTAAIGPNIQQTYTEQAAALLSEPELIVFDIDWALINAEAARWSRTYTFDLVQGLNTTSQRAIQEAVSSYFEQGWTQGDLRQALTGSFGPRRAQLIAVTETTRAAVEGESETVRRLEEDDGIFMRPYWETNNDEIVHKCPICWPRHEKEIRPDNETQGQYPPAHPGCRCWVRHGIIE